MKKPCLRITVTILSSLLLCACISSRHSVSEFKQLKIAEGDYLTGFRNVKGATSASQAVEKFGKPAKSEDLNDFYKSKVLYYDAKDEFGNPCSVKLQFAPVCQSGLDCYGLIGIATESQK